MALHGTANVTNYKATRPEHVRTQQHHPLTTTGGCYVHTSVLLKFCIIGVATTDDCVGGHIPSSILASKIEKRFSFQFFLRGGESSEFRPIRRILLIADECMIP